MLTQLLAQLGSVDLKGWALVKPAALPLALTVAMHLLLLRQFEPAVYSTVAFVGKPGESLAGLLLVALASTVLSSLTPFLFEILEGKVFQFPGGVVRQLAEKQGQTKAELDAVRQLGNFLRIVATIDGKDVQWPEDGTPPKFEDVKGSGISAEMLERIRDHWRREAQLARGGLHFRFPIVPEDGERTASGAAALLSTRFGNIGLTPRAYAISRYSMDLEIFWNRLQRTIRNANANDKFATSIEGLKADVDFAVAMTFLSGGLLAGWTVYLLTRTPVDGVAAIVVAGLLPLVVSAFYELACRNYILFTDAMRTAVDCYRLELLKDLSLPVPANTRAEEVLWERLGDRLGYGVKGSFTYKVKP